MKIEIYEDKGEQEKVVRLRLMQNHSQCATVYIVDESGDPIDDRADLLTIKDNGSGSLYCVRSSYPNTVLVDIDDDGAIRVV